MELVLITNLIVMIIFGLGGFYLAKFKYQAVNGLSPEELNALRNDNAVLQTKLEQATLSLNDKERLLKTEEDMTRNLGQDLATRSSELKSSDDRNKELEAKYDSLTSEFKSLQVKSIELEKNLSGRNIEFKTLEENMKKQKEEIEKLNAKFNEEFKSIANQILLNNSSSFNKQTGETLDTILKPLRENLEKFEKKVDSTRIEQAKETSSLKEQISLLEKLNTSMTEEARNLTNALRGDNKAQGNWGEGILERILDKSGLEKGRDYTIQQQFSSEDEKRYTPDVIVNLPDNKNLIIDSKVSLVAYDNYCSTDDKEQKAKYLKDHIDSLYNQIKMLSAKEYFKLKGLNTPDFVLLFIPIEPSFSLAMHEDPGIYNHAFDKNILLVTPTTLIGALRVISVIWKQEKQNRNVNEIAKEAGGMLDKFQGFVEDMKKIGDSIANTEKVYHSAFNKLSTGKGNLINRARKIESLGGKGSKALPEDLLGLEED
ncbi:MAG TPA: DNA recombination protein RmuC [Leptospiraceae bacterium]|nr:DNA recombination protein RmuC [Leptospiraceae bacterium]HRG76059.1 DNA recombination protein RmuC [Leptospiraceae bacterium]